MSFARNTALRFLCGVRATWQRGFFAMAELIIHGLDDALLVQLKKRAWEEGLPLEESLRRHLTASMHNHERHARRGSKKVSRAPWEADLASWRHALHCL
jgi:hypothetical protein